MVESLSKDLKKHFPNQKGFSRTNLFSMRKWYEFYTQSEVKLEFVQQLVGQIPWGHNVLIITKSKCIEEALFYLNKTIENNWSRTVLAHQIDLELYDRTGKALTKHKMTNKMKQILVTGGAGFIGMHTVIKFLAEGFYVVSIDNLNDYYDQKLKKDRLAYIEDFCSKNSLNNNYSFFKIDIQDNEKLTALFKKYQFEFVCHLAAQVGIRYSSKNPQSYINSNIQGFFNVLEQCKNNPTHSAKHQPIKHFIYASSSSVYGLNTNYPSKELDKTEQPISLYASTKKSNELMAHVYAHLHAIPCTGLRFFTVYGAWGRPDMAYYKFTKAIKNNEKITIYHKNMMRDFTYIDDIVTCISQLLTQMPKSSPPYKIYNVGSENPISVIEVVQTIEKVIGKKVSKEIKQEMNEDVVKTYACMDGIKSILSINQPKKIKEGLTHFVRWYEAYHK